MRVRLTLQRVLSFTESRTYTSQGTLVLHLKGPMASFFCSLPIPLNNAIFLKRFYLFSKNLPLWDSLIYKVSVVCKDPFSKKVTF